MSGKRNLLILVALLAGCSSGSSSSGSGRSTSASTAATTSATVTPAPVTTAAPSGPPPRVKTATVVARAGEGFLEIQNGHHLLHVKGTAYERGLQYGELVGDEIEDILTGIYSYASTIKIPTLLAPVVPSIIAPLYKPYFTSESLDMIQGIVDGAARRNPPVTITTDELIFMNAIIDVGALANLAPLFKCSGHSVWGPRTKGGKMFQSRNVDLFIGYGLEAHAVAVIEKPDQGHAFLNAGWTGMIGSASGMNEHGLGISQVWAFSWDSNVGQPWVLTNRTLLESAENVDSIFQTYSSVQRTYGSNFVFADRGDGRNGQPRAIALESTYKDLAQFDANDPKEDATYQGIPLAIPMPFAVMRGDVALCERINQRQYVHQGSDPRNAGGYKLRYKQQADMTKDYEAKGVLVGADEMKNIASTIAMRGGSLQCVVYENSDLVVHVANANYHGPGVSDDACTQPYERWDLDYYLPTVAATPDKATYSAGDTVALKLAVSNHGRDRSLEVRASLVVAGKTIALPGTTKVTASSGQVANATAALAVPANVAAGPAELLVELVEAGTSDVVDYARVELTIK